MANREQGKKFTFRKLEKDDYDNGLFECLAQLATVGSITKEDFERRFDLIDPQHSSSYKIIVGIDKDTKEIVCYGTILFELKFVHNLGIWGHIEDIVVKKSYNGLQLGRHLIFILKEISRINMCYKIILNWKEELTKFIISYFILK